MVTQIGQHPAGGQGGGMLVRPGLKLRRTLSCKAGALAMLIVATGLVTRLAVGFGGRMANVPTPAVYRAIEPSLHCE
ncbi:hypothetical protein M0D69_20080 [Caballeronia sp. SEWSISQ10-4 2]|uniref:hypothetical protein n=1 Tax=Caballeronia sp. SEWSISQ10-4 2 TaxID=2937438 RepID=UPI00264E1C6A|nr:hypothetical protein [Caballeronia sp. SEWSISQ10-4 2]MDN7180256.1 hypothetical protein [Caballeronia sp. SEWSISQ10-4 2]